MSWTRFRLAAFAAALVPLLSGTAAAQAAGPAAPAGSSERDRLGRAILKELIETNTTLSSGSTTAAAERMAARLVAAGYPKADVLVVGGAEKRKNLVARLRGKPGSTLKPVLFFAHLDVVEARREDWTMDPFVLTEQDGWFYGRGTLDVKGGAGALVTAFCALKQAGFVPDRDLILAETADEESGDDNGIDWLLKNQRQLIEAEYAINLDSGGPELHGGTVTALEVQAAEKVFASFTLTVKNPGGHSSLPGAENAIYRLAAALGRLSSLRFPTHTSELSRAYFAGMAKGATGATAADMTAVAAVPTDEAAATRLSAASPFHNAILRTTCVPTLLAGGHAENALPQTATATVNCRILPDEKAEDIMQALVGAIADPQVAVAPFGSVTPSPASPLVPAVLRVIESASRATWGPIAVIPFMETGATDGLFLRNVGTPVYGVTGIAFDPEDVRAHGKDERILVRSYYEGIAFVERLARAIGGAPAP